MTREEWSAELAHRVGREVRKHRDRQKISAQKLSDRCGELGFPIERSVLSGLESQRRTKISLAEVLVLAMALDVAPIVLIFPVGDVETVELLPNQTASPFSAAGWFSGDSFDRMEFFIPLLRDEFKYQDSLEKLRAYRQHDKLVWTMYDLWAQLHPTPHSRREFREASPAQITARSELMENYAGLLWQRRVDMEAKGMLLPPVPEELREYLAKAELFERRVGERRHPGEGAANEGADQG